MKPEPTKTHARKTQRLHAIIKARQLRVEPVGDAGAVRVLGPGVNITAASFDSLDLCDLLPVNTDCPT